MKTRLIRATAVSSFLIACSLLLLLQTRSVADTVIEPINPIQPIFPPVTNLTIFNDVLDNTNQIFTTGMFYTYPWVGQTDYSHDGTDAAMLLIPAHSYAEATIRTTVKGPARVTFWSLVDSLTPYGFYFEFEVDGVTAATLHSASTLSTWTNVTVDLPFGTHTLVWDADAYGSSSGFLALLDEVTVTPLVGDAPTVTLDPHSVTVQIGDTLTLHANTTGTAPLKYQWSSPASGSYLSPDGSQLTVPNFSRAAAGYYSVSVRNLFGTATAYSTVTAGFQSIADALDEPTWTFDLRGYADWIVQSNVTRNGSSCLQSPPSAYYYNWSPATLSTTITGPVSLKYWIKFDPASNDGGTESDVTIDGWLAKGYTQADGAFDWRQDEIIVPFGEHTVQWQYGFGYYGNGTTWLDTITAEPLIGNVPTITGQNSDTTIEQGQPLTLSATVSGDPPFTYQWMYCNPSTLGCGPLIGETNSTLHLYGNMGDAGSYYVIVDNYFGEAQSTPAGVGVTPSPISLRKALDNPDFIWATESTAPWFGESHVTHDGHDAAEGSSWLRTTAVGPGLLTFWWKSTGDVMLTDYNTLSTVLYQGDNQWHQATVAITAGPHVMEWDAAVDGYAVAWLDSVQFKAGAVPPPVIVEQPHSQTINQTQTVTFSVKVNATDILSYQWMVNGGALDGGTDSTFTIQDATGDNLGAYSVVISNAFGMVQSQPAVLAWQTDLGDAVGDPGTGWSTPDYYSDPTWFVPTDVFFGKRKVLQSSPILDSSTTTERNTIIGPGTLSFWWRTSSETNADVLQFVLNDTTQATISGNTRWLHYTCHIAGGPQYVAWTYTKDWSVSEGMDCGWLADVQFTADPLPSFHIEPHEQTIYEGDYARFATDWSGTNRLTVSWFDSANNEVDDTPSLKIGPVGLDTPTGYTARASGDAGTVYDTATLHVKPSIEGQRVMAGNPITLQLHYPDTNLAGLNWTRNGETLFDDGRIRGVTNPVLHIANANTGDSGAYGVFFARDEGLYNWDPQGSVRVLQKGALIGWGMDDANGGEVFWPSDITEAVSVVTENVRTAAIMPDGTVRMWQNSDGTDLSVPQDAVDVAAIALRYDRAIALKKDGSTVQWFNDDYFVQPLLDGVYTTRAISANQTHVLILDRDGTVTADGTDYSGETDVPSDLKDVTAIAAGSQYSLALQRGGHIVGWGNNDYGQLMPPHGLVAVAIAAGDRHALALRRDGTVVAWGDNSSGQTSVPRGLRGVVAIAAGAKHSVALTRDGRVVTWGGQYSGGLNTASVPIGVRNVMRISAAGSHTFALKYAPDIVTEPVVQATDDPQFSMVTVQASGRSPLSYAWRLNGRVISTSPTLIVRTPANAISSARSKLDVVVRNRYGADVSQKFTIPPLDTGDAGFTGGGIYPIQPGGIGMVAIWNQMISPVAPFLVLPPPPGPRLSITKQNDSIVLSWTQPGAVLESADSIAGPYSAVDATASTNTLTVPSLSQQKFYRLRVP